MRTALDWKKGVDLFFTDKVQQRTTRWTTLALLVLLAAVLAQWTWRLLPAGPAAGPPPATTFSAVSRQGAGGGGQQWNLSQWHLFGIMPDEARLEQVAVEALPETTLNLTLRGVVAAAQDGRDSGAIIGVPNGIDSFYPIDANLPGGATLKEVYADRVVLERAGRLETLRLPKETLENTGAGGDRQAVSRGSGGNGRTLREYRDLALSNPQQLGNVVNVSPRSEAGRFIGYEVQPGQDPGLLDQVGLSPGDVVTSVNGISLDTPARALSVLRSLQGTDQISIDFQRDGVPRSLTVNIP